MSSGAACVAIVIAVIVCYDASHVRYEVGKHASEINRLLSSSPRKQKRRSEVVCESKNTGTYVDVELQREENEYYDDDDDSAPLVDMQLHGDNIAESISNISGAAMTMFLEEAVGHTKAEVVAGVAVGIAWFLVWLPVLVWSE